MGLIGTRGGVSSAPLAWVRSTSKGAESESRVDEAWPVMGDGVSVANNVRATVWEKQPDT